MSESSNQKIVIFEEINSGFFPLASACAKKGDKVCFFRIDKKFLDNPYVKKNLDSITFINLSKVIFNYYLFVKAGACAHKNLDAVFDKFFKKSASILVTKTLYDSPDIENMYKKEIFLYLNDLYYLQYRINAYIENLTCSVEFYPSESSEIHSDDLSPLSKKVKVIRCTNPRLLLNTYHKKLKEYVNLFYPIYILFKKVKWISRRKIPQKKYRLGINANLPALFSWNYHYINYIVDEIYGFPKEEIFFIDETYRKEIPKEFEEHGFAYMDFLHQRVTISIQLFKKVVGIFFPAWLMAAIYSLGEERHIVKSTRLILTDFIRWNILMDSIELKNHVTILLPDTISKNLVLTKHGCKMWFVYPDNYTGDYHSGWDEKIPTSTVYTFINTDSAIIFGNKVKRFFSYNRNAIKSYHTIGVLSAQRIKELRERRIYSSLTPLLKQKNISGKVIGIFDSGFVDWGPNKVADGIRFAEEVLRLLDEIPEISIIFKEKRFLSATPQLSEIYAKLMNHPRCVFVKKQEHNCIFATEVIAYSDLVISVAYTSTTAEALAAKTKAIYYNVAGNNRRENYYFNKFPNLVAHDYEELKKLVQYWLYEVSNEQFEAFLERYVKGEIDPYLDMKAIDRFQEMIQKD
jgi:polysaccharide biosynthesis PFTS motif protein